MSKKLELSGKQFGKLTVLEFSHIQRHCGNLCTFWKCRCECGNIVTKRGSDIVSGYFISCGCIKPRFNPLRRRNPLKGTWLNMNSRCTNKYNHKYPNYGGRGITVCEQWRNDFKQFCKDVGPRPSPKHSIDRIDNNGNYEPENVRWATSKMQCNNTRRNRFISYNGLSLSMSAWSDRIGINRRVIHDRLRRGWPIEKALTTKLKTA